MTDPKISVVIPVFNGEKTIVRALSAVLTQGYSHVPEIIVVDDGSTDSTPDLLKKFESIIYLRQPNQGPAVARNRGARAASGEIIFFTDSDCAPAKDWINQSLKHFKDAQIGVVAGSYGISNPEFILSRSIQAEILFRHHNLMPSYPKVFGSYNFAIRKSLFLNVGGFEESYRHASGEDNDLSYKVNKSGYKIYFEKDSIVNHWHTTDLKKYLNEQYRHGFWRAKMYLDHPSMAAGDDYTFLKDIVEVPVVLLILFAFILLPVKFIFFSLSIFVLLFLLFLMQIYFSLHIFKSIKEIFFFSCVMFARAFVRTLGFSSGIILFAFDKIFSKKVK